MSIMLKMLIMDGFAVQTQRKNPGRIYKKRWYHATSFQGLQSLLDVLALPELVGHHAPRFHPYPKRWCIVDCQENDFRQGRDSPDFASGPQYHP